MLFEPIFLTLYTLKPPWLMCCFYEIKMWSEVVDDVEYSEAPYGLPSYFGDGKEWTDKAEDAGIQPKCVKIT